MIRWGLPLAALALFVATATGYGVFRDELYYVACSRHLDWGYVDHPPLVALVARIFGPSWVALRLVSAVAFTATIVLAGDTARALGPESISDLEFRVNLPSVGILDWGSFEHAVNVGYRHACRTLEAISEDELALYRVRQAVHLTAPAAEVDELLEA